MLPIAQPKYLSVLNLCAKTGFRLRIRFGGKNVFQIGHCGDALVFDVRCASAVSSLVERGLSKPVSEVLDEGLDLLVSVDAGGTVGQPLVELLMH